VSSQGVRVPASQSRTFASLPESDPIEFEFVDPGETNDDNAPQDQAHRNDDGLADPQPEEQAPLDDPPDTEHHHHPKSIHRSSRQPKPPSRLIENAYAILNGIDTVEHYETQFRAEDPITFATSKSDPDTLHFYAAVNAPDSTDFKKVMLQEANAHTLPMNIGKSGRKRMCPQIKISSQ
jgi:hypothetical protein